MSLNPSVVQSKPWTLLMAAMIVVARRSRAVPMIPAACLSALLTAALSLPFATVWPVGAANLLLVELFGATNMGLGLILFTVGSQRVPAAESALIGTLDAPLAPFWVWLAFSETPRGGTIAGGALVLAAVLGNALVSRSVFAPSRRPRSPLPTDPRA